MVTEISFEESCFYVVNFGKHLHKDLATILEEDPGYLDYITSYKSKEALQAHLKVFLDNEGVRHKIDRHMFGN